jgi:hypothetical protein
MMSGATEIKLVILTTVFTVCGLFIGLVVRMDREHKRENAKKDLHKTGDRKNSTGQPDKSVHDVASRSSTTSSAPTTPSQGQSV